MNKYKILKKNSFDDENPVHRFEAEDVFDALLKAIDFLDHELKEDP